jgi:hypothetical protein
MLLRTIQNNVKSVTGYNLKRIMLETGKTNVDQLNDVGIENIEYHPVSAEDKWKILVIKECIDVKFRRLNIEY